MWYLIGIVTAVLAGLFVYANVMKNRRASEGAKGADNPPFRTDEDLNSYKKPLDDKHKQVDFDDAE